jgi:uncharacterized membrane protein required for colicin V production
MSFETVQFGWVDFVTLIVLFLGIARGRKRGLSEELLDTLQWVAIVVAGGMLYEAVALTIGTSPIFGKLLYRIAGYLLVAMVVKLVFSFLKRHIGEKIVGSDLFGGWEYYLGMLAGMVRFACIYVFLLSFLHAPYYSPEMLAANAKYQDQNFGDIRFPTLGTLQHTVFKESFTGLATDAYLGPMLISPTESQPSDLRDGNSLAKKREQSIDALMSRR